MKKQPLISLDLELEQPNSNNQVTDSSLEVSKIIQIGWVIFTPESDGTMTILKENKAYVNIGVPLSSFIKKLTGITDAELESGGTLLEGYQMLCRDLHEFDASRVVLQWGGGDMEHMQMELEAETSVTELHDNYYDWKFGRTGLNVKHLFRTWCLANGEIPNGGLKKSMGKCGLSFEGKGHDAVVDAFNTAKLYTFLENSFRK